MDRIIEHWLECLNYEKLKKMVGQRQIYIWGAYINGKAIRNALEEHGMKVVAYIDGHKAQENYDGVSIISPNNGLNKSNMFIIVSVIGERKEIIEYLKDNAYVEDIDYIYVSRHNPRVVLLSCNGIYEDKYGNYVEMPDSNVECRIELVGYKNSVVIKRGFACGAGSYILVENGSAVQIGENVSIDNEVEIEAHDGSFLSIGDSNLVCKDSRICAKGADIHIGNYVTMNKRFFCINGKTAPIKVGNDCMFANDVSIIASGGHSILNLETKTNETNIKEKYVNIGDHVWLGKGATILYNSEIGNGSVVGANSLVKIVSPENSVIVGNPAKVVKTGTTWDRRAGIDFEDV